MSEYPVVKQKRLNDCGVAALATIFKYLGNPVSIEFLSLFFNVTEDGVSIYDIICVSNRFNIKCDAYSANLANLKEVSLPSILLLKKKKSGFHFVVCYRITEDFVVIADPAFGVKKLTIKKFESNWTGKIIIFDYENMIENCLPIIKESTEVRNLKIQLKPSVLLLSYLTFLNTLSFLIPYYFFDGNIKTLFYLLLFHFVFISLINYSQLIYGHKNVKKINEFIYYKWISKTNKFLKMDNEFLKIGYLRYIFDSIFEFKYSCLRSINIFIYLVILIEIFFIIIYISFKAFLVLLITLIGSSILKLLVSLLYSPNKIGYNTPPYFSLYNNYGNQDLLEINQSKFKNIDYYYSQNKFKKNRSNLKLLVDVFIYFYLLTVTIVMHDKVMNFINIDIKLIVPLLINIISLIVICKFLLLSIYSNQKVKVIYKYTTELLSFIENKTNNTNEDKNSHSDVSI